MSDNKTETVIYKELIGKTFDSVRNADGRELIFSIDGKQLSKVIDEIDFNYVPIQEDVHFNLELLSAKA